MKQFHGTTTLILVALILQNCRNAYDPQLVTPDSFGTGYNLTTLGRFVSGPWEVDHYIKGSNQSIYIGDSLVSSVGISNTELQDQLVFELLKTGKVKYWFKKDYIKQPATDTSENQNSITITTSESKEGEIKKIYTKGSWKYDPKDSTIKINLGDKNDAISIQAKYTQLTNIDLLLTKTSFFDSTINNKKHVCKKVIGTHYEHSWFNKLD